MNGLCPTTADIIKPAFAIGGKQTNLRSRRATHVVPQDGVSSMRLGSVKQHLLESLGSDSALKKLMVDLAPVYRTP